MKRLFAFLSAVAILSFGCTPQPAAEDNTPEEEQKQDEGKQDDETPQELESFTYSVSGAPENNIFDSNPVYTLSITKYTIIRIFH